VDRERRALHDLLAGSSVVYDWGGRPAEMPSPLARWIEVHGDDRDGHSAGLDRVVAAPDLQVGGHDTRGPHQH
jgi:hypothetical protein